MEIKGRKLLIQKLNNHPTYKISLCTEIWDGEPIGDNTCIGRIYNHPVFPGLKIQDTRKNWLLVNIGLRNYLEIDGNDRKVCHIETWEDIFIYVPEKAIEKINIR